MSRGAQVHAVGDSPNYGLHNLSHRHLTSLDFGRIQPLMVAECVENDNIDLSLEQFITSAPNVAPIQGKVKVNTAAFFVRSRVIWDGFNDYHTGMKNLTIPYFELESVRQGGRGLSGADLCDYYAFHSALGLNPHCYMKTKDGDNIRSLRGNMLIYRGYNRIWYDWFRDSNVITDNDIDSYIKHDNNRESWSSYYLLPKYACWKKDMWTNSLRTPNGDSRFTPSTHSSLVDGRGAVSNYSQSGSSVLNVNSSTPEKKATNMDNNLFVGSVTQFGNFASGDATISSLRTALGLQSWLEKRAAVGGRIIDRLRSLFGASVQNESLNMSEFLGMNTFDINFEQTAAHDSSTVNNEEPDYNAFGTTDPAQGTMKGQLTGNSTSTQNGLANIKYHVKEAGYIYVLTWVMPDVMVHEGINPMWFRGIEGLAPSRHDFLEDEFVGKGFDPLYMHEVAMPTYQMADAAIGNYDPFSAVGYVSKYNSYTYMPDIISGCFVDPNTRASMRPWWLSRDFLRESGCVDVDGNWIQGKTGTDFVNSINHDTLSAMTPTTKQAYDEKFVITRGDIDHFVCQCKIDFKVVRRLPSISTPSVLQNSPVATPVGGNRL